MQAYDFRVDGIYYNVTNEETREVEVDDYDCSSSYSGSLVIPDSVSYNGNTYWVTSIGNSAFRSCEYMTSVTIGCRVTSIGNGAFSYCNSLTSVYYTSDIGQWCGINFESLYSNPLYYAHNLYIDNQLVTEAKIPDEVTEIKNYAFSGCSSLTSVTIGNGVTSIGKQAFYNCNLTSLTIPDRVTSIGERAFEGNSDLVSVTIGEGVTSIGSYAFKGCSSLSSVVWNAKSCKDFSFADTPFYYNNPLAELI